MAKRSTPRPPKGTPTSLNLSALADLFGTATSVPNAVTAVDAPHIRRCLKAGLVTGTRQALTLTPEGVEAVTAHDATPLRQIARANRAERAARAAARAN